MNLIEQKFSSFIIISLKILFFLILLGSTVITVTVLLKLNGMDIISLIAISILLILLAFSGIYLFYSYIIKKGNYKKALLIIMIAAFLLRLLWILLVNTQPISDFKLMYDCGKLFAEGQYWVFRGHSYIARFSHLTVFTIYLGFIQKIFIHPITVIKLINLILSTINVYIIYLICTELYDNIEKGLGAALIACIFPPFIIYNSVICSENLAMPFFLFSIYIFMQVIKTNKNSSWLLLSGILLSIGNLFRMVGFVVLIAFIMYLLIFSPGKKAIKSSLLIFISFFIILFSVNTLLLSLHITEYPLWKGSEPAITSVLKGTNINSLGMWNKKDGSLPEIYNYNYSKVSSAAKAIIKKRLTTTPIYKLIGFYLAKFSVQWSTGDFGSVKWATGNSGILDTTVSFSTYALLYAQFFYAIIMFFVYRGLFNSHEIAKNKLLYLFYIIFCGYGLLYLITEQQPRYSYIVSWIFVIIEFSSSLPAFLSKSKKSLDVSDKGKFEILN